MLLLLHHNCLSRNAFAFALKLPEQSALERHAKVPVRFAFSCLFVCFSQLCRLGEQHGSCHEN
jgi:hypothetical protein